MISNHFDVIVVGGGHAACEAALASARLGASTLMLVLNMDHIAQMSCNPCIGGIAKGHVVREIDALGGAMGEAAEASSIQFRMLNGTKGPAVWSPRVQCDKVCYQKNMKRRIETTENLTVRQGLATGLAAEKGSISSVTTSFGETFYAKSVVLATGTFLHGKLHFGLRHFPGGRAGDPPSDELSDSIRNLGLRMGRLKTGTPPRVLASSLDFDAMKVQEGDHPEDRFTHFYQTVFPPEVNDHSMTCFVTYSTAETAAIVKANLDKAPMYNGLIEGIGTRYCPSFEDKVVRFPHHERHVIYLEPEGEYTSEFYVNGISTSLPPEIQNMMLHSIPGLEKCVITRSAYAVEYDFVHPEEIRRTFETRKIGGLFLAGQINGTSGYEEAAAQGLVAGLNAARHAAGLEGAEFTRDNSYVGVLADDLTTKEIVEPYRLFTSRAEYRLSIRQDNADLRLCEKAHSLGLLPENKYKIFAEYASKCADGEIACKSQKVGGGHTLWDVLHDCNGIVDAENPPFPMEQIGLDKTKPLHRRVFRELAVMAHYEGYIAHEDEAAEKLRSLDLWRVPDDFDYDKIAGLRGEARMKLVKLRPATLAQAAKIDGVTPSEIALLQVHLKRTGHNKAKNRE